MQVRILPAALRKLESLMQAFFFLSRNNRINKLFSILLIRRKKEEPKMDATEPVYIIYTDGGCAYNPGGPGGCAAVLSQLPRPMADALEVGACKSSI